MLKLRHTGSPNIGGGAGAQWTEGVSYTLATSQDQTMFVPVDFRNGAVGCEHDAIGTLQAKPNGGYSLNYQPGVLDETEYVVRRLMPVECERLQAFPDGWTDLTGEDPEKIYPLMPQWQQADEKGKAAIERKVRKWCKECPDGHRYRAIGNSMTTSVMKWLGERIQMVSEIAEELDGRADGAPVS